MRRPVVIFLAGLGILLSSAPWLCAQWIRVGKPGGGWIAALAVKGPNLFAATRKGGVFVLTNQGITWKAFSAGLPKRADFQCLAASGSGLFVGTVEKGVFMSTDEGTSWTEVNSGLPKKCSV
jgi:photosystem II stability/assembly factor-like uncharacterized protein